MEQRRSSPPEKAEAEQRYIICFLLLFCLLLNFLFLFKFFFLFVVVFFFFLLLLLDVRIMCSVRQSMFSVFNEIEMMAAGDIEKFPV